MFEKFAASDARNAARSENPLNKDGKDVFTRAEEEAKEKFGEEAATGSSDIEKNCTTENKEDTTGNGFTISEEEGKATCGKEAVTGSSDLETSCSSENKDDSSTTGNDQGKLIPEIFSVYLRSRTQ